MRTCWVYFSDRWMNRRTVHNMADSSPSFQDWVGSRSPSRFIQPAVRILGPVAGSASGLTPSRCRRHRDNDLLDLVPIDPAARPQTRRHLLQGAVMLAEGPFGLFEGGRQFPMDGDT
jgi:hypothetical protein